MIARTLFATKPTMAITVLLGLTACSDVGPGFAGHPVDCAVGFAWADCAPGTLGYKPTQAQLDYQARQPAAVEAQQQRVAQREAEIKAALEECRNARLRGELKSYVESVQCSNPRVRDALQRAGQPFMDLIDIELATRLSNAEKIDRGQMTEAEASLRSAEIHSQMVAEARRRGFEAQAAQNQSSMAQAAQTQAQGALLSGLGAFNASTQPRGFTCTTYGHGTSCY